MERYIDQLVGLSEVFVRAKKDYDADELYDGLPIRMFLGKSGSEFIRNFDVLTDSEITAILQHIEEGMRSEDEDISNSVAVYFWEAAVNISDSYIDNWKKIRNKLHKKSLEYVKVYDAFFGVIEE